VIVALVEHVVPDAIAKYPDAGRGAAVIQHIVATRSKVNGRRQATFLHG
jgi:hypothetical protein